MVRTSKTTTASPAPSTPSTPVIKNENKRTATTAEVTSPSTKKTKVAATAKPAAVAPEVFVSATPTNLALLPEPVVKVDAVAEDKPETDAAILPVNKYSELNSDLQKVTALISNIRLTLKNLEKEHQKEKRLYQRKSKAPKRLNPNRSPSGFVKPTRISNELADFLGLAPGTELARTEVSKKINHYITTNNLQEESNRRKINPDEKLKNMLKLQPNGEQLTYFNLQRYLAQHFPKTEATVGASESAKLST